MLAADKSLGVLFLLFDFTALVIGCGVFMEPVPPSLRLRRASVMPSVPIRIAAGLTLLAGSY
jgi:hypothetical protein